MPITLDYLNINNNPSSQRLRKHIAYIKVGINSTYRIQKAKIMITKQFSYLKMSAHHQEETCYSSVISSTVDEVKLVAREVQ